MELHYGKLHLESDAAKLYDSDERERLFAAARERFPEHQDEQMLDALDFIMDGFASAFAGNHTDDQWQSIADHLAEHVQNGLT
jgi:hypothetical protein